MRNETFSETEDQLASLFDETANVQETVVASAKAYLKARELKEQVEQELKELSARFQASEVDLIRAFDAAGVKSIKIDHEGKMCGLTQTQSIYYSLPSGSLDNAEIMDWLTANGGKDIVKSTIHHATLSSFCKELVSQDAQLHPSVNIAERRGITLRRG